MSVELLAGRFRRELERGLQADTYLLLGRSRTRLRALALQLAGAYLEAQGPVELHPECQILDPDALGVNGLRVEHIAEREEGGISLERALRYRPTGAGRRALLLYEVDRMGPDAQAALLKTSEEPPPGTLLFLTAADLSPLLPALRSRCRTYRLAPLPAEETQRRAAAAGIEADELERLERACGSAEGALEGGSELAALLREREPALRAWLQGRPEWAWLEAPEGATAAEQRAAGQRILAAILGWLARERSLQADRAAALVLEGLVDLGRNITPGVVFEDLQARLEAVPSRD